MRDIEKRVDESIGRTRRTMRAVALAGLGNPSDILEKIKNKNRTAIRSEPVSFGKNARKKRTTKKNKKNVTQFATLEVVG